MPRRKITEADVDRSYEVIALLDVTAHLTRDLDNFGADLLPRVAGSIFTCLELAGRIQRDVHDVLERAEMDQRASS